MQRPGLSKIGQGRFKHALRKLYLCQMTLLNFNSYKMPIKKIFLLLLISLTHHLSNGQINILDSCGLDSSPFLNTYEIKVIDSLFFVRVQAKKPGNMSAKNGFEFQGKQISFYSCTIHSNTNGNGLLSKKDFFSLCLPNFKGHAGRGIIIFNEKEKTASKGFDAVIIVDCPYASLKTKALILRILSRKE
jgi:hypothetical protein